MKLAPVSGQPRPLRQGSSGLGDAYYPDLGNGGYDALHYDIAMRVEPQTNQVTASSTMTARALEPLDRFNLDLHGLEVDRISIDGQQARFERQEDELIITPATPLAEGETFDVKVDYHGRPRAMASQAGGFLVGWKNRGQGIVADSQPDGSHTWFPCNDHPLDKATYSLSVDVPKPYVVAANGNPQGVDDLGERQVFHWNTRDPLASYLATVNVGNYVQDLQVSPGGVSIRNYFPPELLERARFDFARTPEMVDFFSGLFGPYPFETYGVVVVNDPRAVDGAMETQTLSLFMPSLVTGDRRYEDVAAHELAHHWFGNQATVAQWKDLWLHEGFATLCEWLWLEHTEGAEALEREVSRTHSRLSHTRGIAISAPPANDLFNGQVYLKGGLALHALRRELGDETFFKGVRSYLVRHTGQFEKNATSQSFQAVMEEAAGHSLQLFFEAWVYGEELPPLA